MGPVVLLSMSLKRKRETHHQGQRPLHIISAVALSHGFLASHSYNDAPIGGFDIDKTWELSSMVDICSSTLSLTHILPHPTSVELKYFTLKIGYTIFKENFQSQNQSNVEWTYTMCEICFDSDHSQWNPISSNTAFYKMTYDTIFTPLQISHSLFLNKHIYLEPSNNSNVWKIHSFSLQHERHTNIVSSLLNNEIRVNSFSLLLIEKYFLYIIYITIGKLYNAYLKLLWP